MGDKESKQSAVSPSEQETIISYSRDDKTAEVWTSDTTVMTRLDKMCVKAPQNYQCIEVGKTLDGLLTNKKYKIADKKLVSFRTEIGTRNMSDEHRAKVAEHMRNYRKSQSRIKDN